MSKKYSKCPYLIGTRVKLDLKQVEKSMLFIKRGVLKKYKCGTVVGHSRYDPKLVYVKWDHRKSRELIHTSFLKETKKRRSDKVPREVYEVLRKLLKRPEGER